jgi:hypothetical protein
MTEPAVVMIPDASPERSERTVQRIANILLALVDLAEVQRDMKPTAPRLRLVK